MKANSPLQKLIQSIEVGKWAGRLRLALGALAVLLLLVGYDLRQFRNLSTREAMDSAQLARNISEGKGFTTQFIRPLSLFLVKRANQGRVESLSPEQKLDLSQVRGAHPDIANAPAYPVLLAGLMKVAPSSQDLAKNPSPSGRYRPDLMIALFNQGLFLLLVLLTFRLARALFDDKVAWLSAIILFGTELLWRFSTSGLSTMLLLVLFMLLVFAVMKFEASAREPLPNGKILLGWAAVIGVLLGVGMLTRYSYGVLLLPALVFVAVFGAGMRTSAALVILVVFAAVVTPWIARNLGVCGEPFGTAGYELIDNTAGLPGQRLESALEPNLARFAAGQVTWKCLGNLRTAATTELPGAAGGWIGAFFLVGLMLKFRNPAIARLRYFVIASLLVLLVAQAAGRTVLSDHSPVINSQNLVVLVLPLLLIYGVSVFETLKAQISTSFPWMRTAIVVVFVALATLPLTQSFFPSNAPPTSDPRAVVFPPYRPADIQKVSKWMGENELMMSDVPWAVAWYGNRQAILPTLNLNADFYTLNDYTKPVSALYLTPATLDLGMLTLMQHDASWADFVLRVVARDKTLPAGFPLTKSVPPHVLPAQMFFSDWERWLKSSP